MSISCAKNEGKKSRKRNMPYFGLVPRQARSGDENRLGHFTREGAPVVRQLRAEAAWQARRRSPTFRAYSERGQRDFCGEPTSRSLCTPLTPVDEVESCRFPLLGLLDMHGNTFRAEPGAAPDGGRR